MAGSALLICMCEQPVKETVPLQYSCIRFVFYQCYDSYVCEL